MSVPIPRWEPAAMATLIFVPTPSVLAARWPPPGSAYSPANGPTPTATPLPCVAAMSGLTRSRARSYAAMSTPAAAYERPSAPISLSLGKLRRRRTGNVIRLHRQFELHLVHLELLRDWNRVRAVEAGAAELV